LACGTPFASGWNARILTDRAAKAKRFGLGRLAGQ
jgi:hypothetical protein